MSKYLFIIESPGKQKKIQSFLGKDYLIIPTYGHIVDLPPKKIGVNIKNNFEPTYEINYDKKDVVKNIKEKASKADMVYIATDLDREGSLIANGLISIFPKNTSYKRVKYNSITKKEILESIDSAGGVDFNLVNSAEARRILDRLVGWKCSFITKQATGGTSVGRVQSATLRILAEREKEIKSFISQEYWPIEAELETKNKDIIIAKIKKPDPLKIKNGEEAKNICTVLENNNIIVSKFESKDVLVKTYAPFITSTLYQSAASILGWGSDKTANVAQKLYENGRCTYCRTDSTYIVPEFTNQIREFIPTKYGKKYLSSPVNTFSNKKGSQEAHEAIRVTDLSVEGIGIGDESKLYKIIWKRTIASQMSPMQQKRSIAEFKCKEYVLSANGSKVIFDGWRKCWDYGSIVDFELPILEVNDKVKLLNLKTEQKFTQPPPRYNDRSIIKEMEKLGIGRPSTYATTIKTLINREYIEKIKKAIHTTEIGIKVIDFLIECDFCFVNLKFTSDMEEKLDDISQNKIKKLDVLSEFWKRLQIDINNAKNKKEEKEKSDYNCPKCNNGSKLILKHSKFGEFYSCENRTNKEIKCDYKADVEKNGEPKEKEKKKKKEINYSDKYKCPNCGEYFVIRTNKKGGEYLGCENWKIPKCKGFYNFEDGFPIIFKKKKYNKKKKD